MPFDLRLKFSRKFDISKIFVLNKKFKKMQVTEESKTSKIIGSSSSSQIDKLEVTIIPVDDEPYSKTISLPQSLLGKF